MRSTVSVLARKVESSRRYRWVNNIKINIKDIGCDVMDMFLQAQDKQLQQGFVNTVRNLL
jgi:hypothetical protein